MVVPITIAILAGLFLVQRRGALRPTALIAYKGKSAAKYRSLISIRVI
jgi:hypothetical protein